MYAKNNTDPSLPSDRSASFGSLSSTNSWKCPSPPEKGRDDRDTKSCVDLLYWAPDGKSKFTRKIGETWCEVKSLKCHYEAAKSEEDSKKGLRESSSEGSKLTEGSFDSFDGEFAV